MYLIGITLPDTAPSWVSLTVSAIPILMIVGGWLLARESRGKVHIEIAATILLVAATVVPSGVFTMNLFVELLTNIVQRAPVVLILIGFAWVADKGVKAFPGAAMVLIGLLALVGVSHL